LECILASAEAKAAIYPQCEHNPFPYAALSPNPDPCDTRYKRREG